MIAYVGRAYCKEHTIPVVKTVAPFLRDFPFHIHSRLPINAVQFTILSIIAMGYKPAVAYYRSECYRYCWPISITQQLIKRYSMLSIIHIFSSFSFLFYFCIVDYLLTFGSTNIIFSDQMIENLNIKNDDIIA